jgi:6-pyruvoyltetrahydropterin/6-carboxytetrahydropterin synthase
VEVEVGADALAGPGWVTDFGDLAPFGRYLGERFDHRHLNEVLRVQPTSENLAVHFYEWCAEHLDPVIPGRVTAVRVSEKRGATWAEYRPDDT